MRPVIKCKRHDIIKIPSVMLAEYEHELDKSQELSAKVRMNIERENQIQKEKFMKLKQKYDREGVEYVDDEMAMMNPDQARKPSGEKAVTRSGARKPGQTSSGEFLNTSSINMGADNDNEKNPLTMIINAAKKTFNG